MKAYATGISALSALIGDTTPMRPVESPAYKQIKPKYPQMPASAPGMAYPSSPKA